MAEKVGRPAKFKTVEELDNMISDYFESLKYINDDNREQMSQPAISDLAYELGFCSRQSIYDYKGKDEFSYSIKRALLFIEGWHEKNSCGRNPTGSIFIMKNMGWKDKHEVDNRSVDGDGNDVKPTTPVLVMTKKELEDIGFTES